MPQQAGKPPFSISIVEPSELAKGRLDPTFYHPEYLAVIKRMKERSPYRIYSLADCVREKIRRGETPSEYVPSGVPVLKTSNIQADEINWAGLSYVDEDFYQTHPNCHVEKNNILITSTGVGTLGRIGIVDREIPCAADSHLSIVATKDSIVKPNYVLLFLRSIYGQIQINRSIHGYTGQIELYPEDIEAIELPRPPLRFKII